MAFALAMTWICPNDVQQLEKKKKKKKGGSFHLTVMQLINLLPEKNNFLREKLCIGSTKVLLLIYIAANLHLHISDCENTASVNVSNC